jgi:hypothetical protein
MLNVDYWLWIYTCLMLIIGCGDCMYRIMLLNSYMPLDDDNCGACIYERWLCLVLIIWWMIGDKHVYVMLFVEHVKCWLLVVNSYMSILMVILLVNVCMQNEGDIGYYIQCWWVCCWIYVLVLSPIFMHTWLMLMDFISVWWRWWCFCCIISWRHRRSWWYRVHVGVVSRRITYIWWVC